MSNIALFGVHQQGLDIVRHLGAKGINVSCLVTLSESMAEKSKAAGWVDYAPFAREHGLDIYSCRSYSLKHADDIAFLERSAFDIVLLGGWQRLIPEVAINCVKYAIIGQHGSSEFLPRGRGRSPLSWCVMENRRRLVWNLFEVAPGIDNGRLLATEIFDINEWDDARTLYYKVSIVVKQMLERVIPKLLTGELQGIEQEGEPTFYRKFTPDDRKIDWGSSIYSIYNTVRASTRPYPGAFTTLNGVQYSVWKAQVFDTKITYQNVKLGEIVEVFDGGDLLVHGADGLLLIRDSEIPGQVGDVLGYGTVAQRKEQTGVGLIQRNEGFSDPPTPHMT